ncbi:PilW family protein [Chitinimonas sp. PSY-7]|uniref:PilW family protein n=1 Tax=Chitinimonas sp. PSY-7 TaxID=3459088 RepID=UPI0040403010
MMMTTRPLGFTLLELLVSMAIASVAMLGVSKLYINAQQTSRVQVSQSRLTEDGRYAISMLKRVVTQAGYHSPTDPAYDPRFTAADAKKMTFVFKSDGSNMIDCSGAVHSAANIDVTMTISGTTPSGTTPMKLNCASTGGVSGANWLDGQSSSVVEDLQFSYGIDNGPPPAPTKVEDVFLCKLLPDARDCVADTYVSAPTVAQQKDIVSVRVCLLLRSFLAQNQDLDIAVPETKCDGSALTNPDYKKYFYRKFTTTVVLRNS